MHYPALIIMIYKMKSQLIRFSSNELNHYGLQIHRFFKVKNEIF
jgi:hypothetical protein